MSNTFEGRPAASRRRFLRGAAAAAAIPTAAAVLGGIAPAAAEAEDLPDYAPVPPGALGPAVNAEGYYVGRIKGELYWVTDSTYQAMFLSTRDGVVLVDAPPTIGHNLLRAIDDVTKANHRPSRITHLVYSHYHADHIGAAAILGEDVERIGHTETRRLLRRAKDPNRPEPTVTFEDRHVLEVGGERLELAYHGPNHSPDNIFVFAPAQETLMVVDVLFPGWTPFKNLAMSQDIPGWLQANHELMRYPWKTFVGGHLGRLGTRADGQLQNQYLADLTAGAQAAVTGFDPTPYFAKYGSTGNAWAIFATYLDAAAEHAAAPVITKYTGQLAAVDVFTTGHAYTLIESLRIDSGVLGSFGVHP